MTVGILYYVYIDSYVRWMCMYHSRTRQLSCPFVVVPLLSDINVYVTLLLNAETNPQYGYGLIMDLIWLWNRIRKISGGLRIFCIIYYDTPCRCLRFQYILQVYIMLRKPWSCRRLYSACYEMRYMLKIESTLERVLRCRVVYPIISSRTLPTRMKHRRTMQEDTCCLKRLHSHRL